MDAPGRHYAMNWWPDSDSLGYTDSSISYVCWYFHAELCNKIYCKTNLNVSRGVATVYRIVHGPHLRLCTVMHPTLITE